MPDKGNTKGVHLRWYAHVRSEALVRAGLYNNLSKQTSAESSIIDDFQILKAHKFALAFFF